MAEHSIPISIPRHEKPAPWLIVALVIGGLIVLAVAGGLFSGENSPSVADTSSGADIGQGSGSSDQPVAVETETPDMELATIEPTAETSPESESEGLKLLKKIGPIELLPYKKQMPGVAMESQSEKFALDKYSSYVVSVGTNGDTGMAIKGLSSEKVILLMILRDSKGNPITESKTDKETGICYVAKGTANPDIAMTGKPFTFEKVYVSPDSRQQAKTWEVLVYS